MSGRIDKPKEQQKRKRVTRACDTCRQKKVKCDGRQPCIHCTVYSYNCTYDQPNIRNKKNSGIPLPSFNSSSGNPLSHHNPSTPHSHPHYHHIASGLNNPPSNMQQRLSLSHMDPVINNENSNSNMSIMQNLINLLLPKLKLNVNDEKPVDFDFNRFQKLYYHAQFKNNGNVNLNHLMDAYNDLNTTPSNSPGFHDGPASVSSDDYNIVGKEIGLDLPSKEVALQLIYTTWNKACVLFRFYHRPSLLEEVELFYSLEPNNYTDRQQKFLPFLYSILAVGLLFSRLDNVKSPNNDSLQDDGFRYFLEARKLIDITNAGDIISIQTIIMMIIYLQCSARLSTCYSYVGIALRSALKEGLHRNLLIFQNTKRKLDPIEIDTRKRLFYTIYKMDIYINSLLGLPKSVDEDEFDQSLPEDLDDENITREGFNYGAQQGKLSSSGCANHHTRLMLIISHVVRDLYPIKVKKESPDAQVSPDVIHNKVTSLEMELKNWLDSLPKELKPTDPSEPDSTRRIPERFVLANYYLHLAFLNCQIMLYRPFIHFISHGNEYQLSDPRSLIRGRNCIKIARLVVKLANKMIDQNLLAGTYWFSMYTIFFSIACLIYYYHFVHNAQGVSNGTNYAGVFFDDDLDIDMIMKDIEIGKKVLDCLKHNSNASLRIYTILNNLFEQLNRRTANTSKNIGPLLTKSGYNDIPKSQIKKTLLIFESINYFGDENRNSASYDLDDNNMSNLGGIDNSSVLINQPNETQGQVHGQSQGQQVNQLQQKFNTYDLGQNNNSGRTMYDSLSDINNSSGVYKNNDQKYRLMLDTTETNFTDPPPMFSKPLNQGNEFLNQDSSNNDMGYVPGVIDKLDAQIFGRILPPYMLETNSRHARNVTNENNETYDNDDTKGDPNNQNEQPNPFSVKPESDPSVADLNINDFNLDLLDSRSLEYLDPFHQIN